MLEIFFGTIAVVLGIAASIVILAIIGAVLATLKEIIF